MHALASALCMNGRAAEACGLVASTRWSTDGLRTAGAAPRAPPLCARSPREEPVNRGCRPWRAPVLSGGGRGKGEGAVPRRPARAPILAPTAERRGPGGPQPAGSAADSLPSPPCAPNGEARGRGPAPWGCEREVPFCPPSLELPGPSSHPPPVPRSYLGTDGSYGCHPGVPLRARAPRLRPRTRDPHRRPRPPAAGPEVGSSPAGAAPCAAGC